MIRESVHTAFQGLTAVAAVAALLFTARSLDYTAEATDANREQVRLVERGQVTERFSRAIDQLGQPGDDKLSIRLGGIYALERLMRDSAADEPTVIEVLCAFVRTASPRPHRVPHPVPASPPDVRAAVTVLARRPAPDAKENARLDLSRTLLGLDGVYIPGADLTGADLTDARLTDADLDGAILIATKLANANLIDTNLTEANLRFADLTYADLGGANLTEADLGRANLGGADLGGADLTYANLDNANLLGANLSGTELIRANLTGADLTGADLRGADLTDANLTDADLASADLRGADLTDANLTDAKADERTRLPGGTTAASPEPTR
ncbi:pentapeptide repeat-containing protein [Plantactinospora sp. BB1]|uniref:pentapeptide repeat-containing protein n=1 Tax=Plantactinospora sp. BB1 TaxID=2071627 RepID=UPI00131F3C85|nr:pentapeptide repeat-containing protein [Plantactinospora sp. BB1]